MQVEPRIVFQGFDPRPEIEQLVRDKIAKLEKFYDRITSCSVNVEKETRKGHQGHLYKVTIHVDTPIGEVAVSGKPGDLNAHEDPRVAIRDSFDAARRQLEDLVRKADGTRVKPHPERVHGTVVRLFPDEGYGFIRMENGDEFYFHRDSIEGNGWDRLDLETRVTFTAMDGDKGPFAANVTVRD